jgi:hypothetical protein
LPPEFRQSSRGAGGKAGFNKRHRRRRQFKCRYLHRIERGGVRVIVKDRDVGTGWQVDSYGIVRAIVYVILREPLADLPRAHSHDANVRQIFRGIALENFYGERPLF